MRILKRFSIITSCINVKKETNKEHLHMDNEQKKAVEKPPNKIGADVYLSVEKLNYQLATQGPAVILALGKVSEQVGTESNLVTAIGGLVLGSFGFFGNRYYRRKGEDSAYSYMGQTIGAVQFITGGLLLAMEAFKVYHNKGDATPLLNVVKLARVSLTITSSAFILVNSYLYGGGPRNTAPVTKPKMP